MQATSDIDMYWVGPVYVRCGGKGTELKGTKRQAPKVLPVFSEL